VGASASTHVIEVNSDPRGEVEAAVRAALAAGELGLQVSAVRGGEILIDVAGGVSAPRGSRPVTTESLFPVFSVTKGIVAAGVLRMVADGLIDLDVPVKSWWPEFEQNGKAATTMRHMLTHTAGLPEMPVGCTVEQMCDWSWMVRQLETRAPTWEPGATMAYHAYTFGWLVGEVLRRASGGNKSPGHLVTRLVAAGAGTDDFYIGLPPSLDDRVVILDDSAVRGQPSVGLRRRALPPDLAPGQNVFGRTDVRRSEHLGAGGIATAVSLARIYADLAQRTFSDHDAWGRELERASRIAKDELDHTLQVRVARGLGYFVGGTSNSAAVFPFDSASSSFGHSGAGGSLAWADLSTSTGFAITRSRLTPAGRNDPNIVALARAVHRAVRLEDAC
jgi:CubicO group peptidase (beta-lactamase class C family)